MQGLFGTGSISRLAAALGFSEEMEEPEEELLFLTEEEHAPSQNYNLWLIPPTLTPRKEAHEGEVMSNIHIIEDKIK